MENYLAGEELSSCAGSSTEFQNHGQVTTEFHGVAVQENRTTSFGKGVMAVPIESTKCILCLAQFKSSTELRDHIRIVHDRGARLKQQSLKKENLSNNSSDITDTPEKAPTPLIRYCLLGQY